MTANDHQIILYTAPYTCARVPAIVMREIGLDFEIRPICILERENRSPEFLAINPLGKVPAITFDGIALTENVAIISYLNDRFPDAGIMPLCSSLLGRHQQLADLCLCSSTLAPLVQRICMPQTLTVGEARGGIHEMALKVLDNHMHFIEPRLAGGKWWYGERWSAVDAYLYWVTWRISGVGVDLTPYPNLLDHLKRNQDRPSVIWADAIDTGIAEDFIERGRLAHPPMQLV